MKRRIWVDAADTAAYHAEVIAEHGGTLGVRDRGLLESALARPQNLAAYGQPNAFELAAAYAYGITRNHPFVDGNKRVALVASVTFLELNGSHFGATEEEAAMAFLELAGGKMTENEIARWLKENCRKVPKK